jgi:hypothetical protein
MPRPHSKLPLRVEMIDFALRGVTILRAAPGLEYRILAGPFFADETVLLRGALQNHRTAHGLAICEEQGGINIYRRV